MQRKKIRFFQNLFTGLPNVYGTYDPKTGRARQVKEPVTEKVIAAHLSGKNPYGVYLLTGDRTNALVVDFDLNDISLPVAYVANAKRCGIASYIEKSKSKGYHVWIFFEPGGVLARKARLVAHQILADMGEQKTEVFPKQDALTNRVSYGNFINTPLFGALVPQGRTVFVDHKDPTKPYADQWELLENVKRVPQSRLDAVIKRDKLDKQVVVTKKPKQGHISYSGGNGSLSGLPPCGRKMLTEGVVLFQRVACFRLAVQLKQTGLPCDMALCVLKAWAKKNRPLNDKRVITDSEIRCQVKYAFEKSYRCFGCSDPAITPYCDKSCSLYTSKPKIELTMDGTHYRTFMEGTIESLWDHFINSIDIKTQLASNPGSSFRLVGETAVIGVLTYDSSRKDFSYLKK